MNPHKKRWMWYSPDEPGEIDILRHKGLSLMECVSDYYVSGKPDGFMIVCFDEGGKKELVIGIDEAERILKLEKL